MKPRRVMLNIEVETDMRVADLRKGYLAVRLLRGRGMKGGCLKTLQVQANVIKQTKKK